jgi:hypothetical protein
MATTVPAKYAPQDLLRLRPMPELIDGRLVGRFKGQRIDGIAVRFGIRIGTFVSERRLRLTWSRPT